MVGVRENVLTGPAVPDMAGSCGTGQLGCRLDGPVDQIFSCRPGSFWV